MEVFKDIKGYEDLYSISDIGRVKSIKSGRFLKFDIKKVKHTSYARVTLSKNGKTKRFQVHRLVGLMFLSNLKNKPYINHIDNNGLNNIVSNLEWVTHSENMIHSAKQGRIPEGTNNLLKSAEVLNANTEIKYKKIFGSRFVRIEIIGYRKFLTFLCSDCNKDFTLRTDSPSVKRNGLCQKCFRKR